MLVTALFHCLHNVHVSNLLIQKHLNGLKTHEIDVQINKLPDTKDKGVKAIFLECDCRAKMAGTRAKRNTVKHLQKQVQMTICLKQVCNMAAVSTAATQS